MKATQSSPAFVNSGAPAVRVLVRVASTLAKAFEAKGKVGLFCAVHAQKLTHGDSSTSPPHWWLFLQLIGSCGALFLVLLNLERLSRFFARTAKNDNGRRHIIFWARQRGPSSNPEVVTWKLGLQTRVKEKLPAPLHELTNGGTYYYLIASYAKDVRRRHSNTHQFSSLGLLGARESPKYPKNPNEVQAWALQRY